ncbi:MAG: arginine--tRNA ligase, partial [Fidelibacterota bacterium]
MISKVECFIRLVMDQLEYPSVPFKVQIPARPELGDFATNAALLLAGKLRRPPMEIARQLTQSLIEADDGFFISIETAPPGFINFRINQKYFYKELKSILQYGEQFGRSDIGSGKTALVEFV